MKGLQKKTGNRKHKKTLFTGFAVAYCTSSVFCMLILLVGSPGPATNRMSLRLMLCLHKANVRMERDVLPRWGQLRLMPVGGFVASLRESPQAKGFLETTYSMILSAQQTLEPSLCIAVCVFLCWVSFVADLRLLWS